MTQIKDHLTNETGLVLKEKDGAGQEFIVVAGNTTNDGFDYVLTVNGRSIEDTAVVEVSVVGTEPMAIGTIVNLIKNDDDSYTPVVVGTKTSNEEKAAVQGCDSFVKGQAHCGAMNH